MVVEWQHRRAQRRLGVRRVGRRRELKEATDAVGRALRRLPWLACLSRGVCLSQRCWGRTKCHFAMDASHRQRRDGVVVVLCRQFELQMEPANSGRPRRLVTALVSRSRRPQIRMGGRG